MEQDIVIEGGEEIERLLLAMQRDVATKIIWGSIQSAARIVKLSVAAETPEASRDSKGNKRYPSRNHPKGTLKRSVFASLRKRAKVPRDVFVGAVGFNSGGKNNSKDGWYAQIVASSHNTKGNRRFIELGLARAKAKARARMGINMRNKIAKQMQLRFK